jgi:hypothetical protein
MNKLLALISAAVLAGCAANSNQSLTPGSSPVEISGAHSIGAHDRRFDGVSTVALQVRRLDLYKQVPRSAKRYGSSHLYTTAYETHGGPIPAQDEILLIERELNWRHGHGDRAAYFSPAAPQMPPYSQQSGG